MKPKEMQTLLDTIADLEDELMNSTDYASLPIARRELEKARARLERERDGRRSPPRA